MKINGKQPNFLIITTDEERFPPPYENSQAKEYRLKHSACMAEMRRCGMEFMNHNAAATACAPSRTSIYTGQYPSLHGVSQTPGIGKSSFDQNMFWLTPNTVPTMGSWFREAGYQPIIVVNGTSPMRILSCREVSKRCIVTLKLESLTQQNKLSMSAQSV